MVFVSLFIIIIWYLVIMIEKSPKTKTKLGKTTKATIAAMVVIATIIAAPMITNKLAFAASTTANTNPT
jgi:hypothetical protein